MILSFLTYRARQTVETHIRLLLEEQSDKGVHCLRFCLHILDALLYCWKDFILIFSKCPNFQRAITPEKYGEFLLNLNQVIYSSSPISWPSFKPLAHIRFERSCWQDFVQFFSKGHNSRKGDNLDKKKIRISYFSMRNPYMKFQNPSRHGS